MLSRCLADLAGPPILASVAALVFAAGAVAVVAAVAGVLLLSLWLSLCLELLIFLVCIQRKTTFFCACFHQENLLRDLRLFAFGMIQFLSLAAFRLSACIHHVLKSRMRLGDRCRAGYRTSYDR